MIAAILTCCLMAAEPEANNDVRMVVGYNQGATSRAMFPVLARLRKAGHDIVYVNVDKPEGKTFLETFRPAEGEKLPYYLVYVGHEAYEKESGVLAESTLDEWLKAIKRGDRTRTQPTHQREYLQEPKDKPLVYLRRSLSAPSCGMAWCYAHRYEVLEWVDENGNVVGKPGQ